MNSILRDLDERTLLVQTTLSRLVQNLARKLSSAPGSVSKIPKNRIGCPQTLFHQICLVWKNIETLGT